ncbi:MAG: acyl-CoA reductase [Flavobacteriales bacterium]|nr:acyl-CoA reductase [Flavobacteriales bacterium]|tara:strand:- start:1982 stop:2992 length:1011 start_codon:yes stop_codon:yes gene_type:complete
MILEDRIIAFEYLRDHLLLLSQKPQFEILCQRAYENNNWFTKDSINYSLLSLCSMIKGESLRKFVAIYKTNDKPKKVGVVVPSNLPFVGFYDFLCVLLSGNIYVGKLSKNNNIFIPFVSEILIEYQPDFKKYIHIVDDFKTIDILIATGSNLTARYFNYKYANIAKIVRKDRVSVGVLNGLENTSDFEKIAYDIYSYFGLGCRSVSKLFIPRQFNINKLKDAFSSFLRFNSNANYMDNYNYQKSLFTLNNTEFIDFDNLLLFESNDLHSPISVLYYQYYDDMDALNKFLLNQSHQIQCIVANDSCVNSAMCFGQAQQPTLFDFPDGVDVMKFLFSS